MTSNIITAYREWLTEYPFTVFHTVTWPSLRGRVKSIPNWSKRQLNDHIRDVAKRLRVTLGGLGFITLGHSGHLHSHMLLLEKSGSPLTEDQLTAFGSAWRHESATSAVTDSDKVASYIASRKHLSHPASTELVGYGSKLLERMRLR